MGYGPQQITDDGGFRDWIELWDDTRRIDRLVVVHCSYDDIVGQNRWHAAAYLMEDHDPDGYGSGYGAEFFPNRPGIGIADDNTGVWVDPVCGTVSHATLAESIARSAIENPHAHPFWPTIVADESFKTILAQCEQYVREFPYGPPPAEPKPKMWAVFHWQQSAPFTVPSPVMRMHVVTANALNADLGPGTHGTMYVVREVA